MPSLRTYSRHKEGVGDIGFGFGDPVLGVTDLEGIDGPTKNLIGLARYLAKISPAERGVLDGVERKMVVQALRRLRAGPTGDTISNSGVRTAGLRGKRGNEHGGGEEGSEEGEEDGEDGEDVLDPRGRAPREGDPPVHIFVDQ